MLGPESSTFTQSGSSNLTSILTSRFIALNISPKNVVILRSTSSLGITVVYFDVFLGCSCESSLISLLSTDFTGSALTGSYETDESATFCVSVSFALTFASTGLSSFFLTLITASFLPIPRKPALPFSITSYSTLSLVVSNFIKALVSASSTFLPETSI